MTNTITMEFVNYSIDPIAHQRFVIGKLKSGKDSWNQWRDENPNRVINCSGVDFKLSDNKVTIFTDYNFGNSVNFTNAKFAYGTNFNDAVFGDKTVFKNTTFRELTTFTRTKFGHGTIFQIANFGNDTKFDQTRFENNTSFADAVFGNNFKAKSVTFGTNTSFSRAKFSNDTLFEKISFAESISFRAIEVQGNFVLRQINTKNFIDFSKAIFHTIPEFDFQTEDDKLCFEFYRASFQLHPSFLKYKASERNVSSIQKLRSICDSTNSINESRDLFILQRQAERSILWRNWFENKKSFTEFWKAGGTSSIMFFYWLFSNYGKSFTLPLGWLIAGNTSFYYLYKSLIPFSKFPSRSNALLDFSLANATPFGKISNPAFTQAVETLFQKSTESHIFIPVSIQLIGIFQGLFSAVTIFLVGLAIRNFFKIS